MPLQQRIIEPVNVSRSTLPLPPGDIKPLIKTIPAATGQGLAASAAAAANINIANELECVTNGTLANLIRQLSSLSRQAEELLTGVFEDASKLLTRAATLQQRMETLSTKVETLEQPSDATIILRDPANQHETFSSDMSCDQQVLSKQQMPSSIKELYETCDRPPPLNKLDSYRDDGKDGLKFYTDPSYFFELWKKDMMKETFKAQQQQPTQVQLQHHLRQQLQQQQNRVSGSVLDQVTLASSHSLSSSQTAQKEKSYVLPMNGSNSTSPNLVYGTSSSESYRDIRQQSKENSNSTNENVINAMSKYLQQTAIQDRSMPIYQQTVTHANMRPNQIQQYPNLPFIQQQQGPLNPPQTSHFEHDNMQKLDIPTTLSQMSLQQIPQKHEQSQLQQYESGMYGTQTGHPDIATPPPPPALSPLPPPTSPPPPPPAPPAPPPAPAVLAQTTTQQQSSIIQPPTAAQLQQKQQQLRKTVPIQRDPRSDLLAAIKQGITLKRVEDSKRRVEAEKQQSMGNDVASILARRVAMQVSDSDENPDDDDDEDNDWDNSSNR